MPPIVPLVPREANHRGRSEEQKTLHGESVSDRHPLAAGSGSESYVRDKKKEQEGDVPRPFLSEQQEQAGDTENARAESYQPTDDGNKVFLLKSRDERRKRVARVLEET